MNKKRLAILEVSAELFKQFLLLPEDVEIEAVWSDNDRFPPRIMVRLSGPQFRIVKDGEHIGKVTASYREKYTKHTDIELVGFSGDGVLED